MGRAIDIDKLCTDLMERWDIADKQKEELVKQVMADIVTPIVVSQPIIELEIVRCKDCEYGEQDEYGRWYCRGFGCQVGDEDGSGFCSDAERKNNV